MFGIQDVLGTIEKDFVSVHCRLVEYFIQLQKCWATNICIVSSAHTSNIKSSRNPSILFVFSTPSSISVVSEVASIVNKELQR
jgi:hypothetical protein